MVALGAGESGVGAALLARQQGFMVWVSDAKTIEEKHKEELALADIPYEENGHSTERILAASLIIKSPGIPEKAPVMAAIREAGIEVVSEIEFAFRFKGKAKVVAITGSNGKSTTTTLLWHLLHESGYDASLVGNIGYSFARQIAVKPTDWYVVEVSSFQLDDIKTFRPDIALLLNITPDHLDRYHNDFQEYVSAKFKITENQTADDLLILNADDPAINEYLNRNLLQARQVFYTMNEQANLTGNGAWMEHENIHIEYNGDYLDIPVNELQIQGRHNHGNAMAAGIGVKSAGIRNEKIREAFTTFAGLEHRMEFVATIRGVRYINDSKATNINSVWFSLEDLHTPTILILGGMDKGNDYTGILEGVREKVKAIICIGVDNSKIHEVLGHEVPIMEDAESAEEAVQKAYKLAITGDTVLLAPGCASFDRFKNYEDRGHQFKAAVMNL